MHVVLTQDNDKETYYNAETSQLQRYHQYGNVQGQVWRTYHCIYIYTEHVTSYLNVFAEIRGLPSQNFVNFHDIFCSNRLCRLAAETSQLWNMVVSCSCRDCFHSPGESGLATQD